MATKSDQQCVICLGSSGAACSTFSLGGRDGLGFNCEACGDYEISRTALADWFGSTRQLDARRRAVLSHRVRTADRSRERPLLTTDSVGRFVENTRLPSPALQSINLIRVIGDYQCESGQGYFVDSICDAPLIGAFNTTMFDQLLNELLTTGILVKAGTAEIANPRGAGVLKGGLVGLSLEGWERYEAERRGKTAGRYAFLAMKFGDQNLDGLATRAIKAEIEATLGYSVVDLRDVSRAGIIDNILREQIRDAAFVLVDLTHDNSGAYWEAGYAEGLGKPVIYLCERSKFDAAKTHFDTNHCTTVLWSLDNEPLFARELVATIRRSLNLFAEA